jgi:hypothetical protein
MSIFHFILPSNTPCPFNTDISGAPIRITNSDELRMRVRQSSSSYEITKECNTCGKKHTPRDFKDLPEYYELIQKGIQKIKEDNLPDAEESAPESEQDFVEIIPPSNSLDPPDFVEIIPPPDLLQDDIAIVNLRIKLEFERNCTNIAQKYEDEKNKFSQVKKDKFKPSSSFKSMIWKQYHSKTENLCPCCDSNQISFDNYHLGHIWPESFGGPNEPENFIPICSQCNCSMGTRHLYYWTWITYKRALWR